VDISLLILLAAGPIGAIDGIYFHLWKFRLYERPQSVKEEITHINRGFLVPCIIATLLLGHPEGLWYWTVGALFAFDSLNNVLDVIFEPYSRAPRIVPPAELVTHYLGTSMMGAASATFLIMGWQTRHKITAIVPRTDSFLPDWLITMGFFALAAALGLLVLETFLFLRAVTRRRAQVEVMEGR
jgi:hypothetical protein